MKRFQVRHIAVLSFVLAMMIPSSYLHCGTSTVQKPATAGWQPVYTQQSEIFASYGTGEDRTALQIKSVDMQKATDIVTAWIVMAWLEDVPVTEEQKAFAKKVKDLVTEEQKASAKKVKDLFGGAAPIDIASASQILGMVPDLQLDLCATSCGTDAFKPVHTFQGRPVTERSVTATRALDSTPIAQWFYAGPDTSLNFMDCGAQSVSRLLGLQHVPQDWSLAKTDQEWIAGVTRVWQAKSLSKPIACLQAAEKICVKTFPDEKRGRQPDLKTLFSITDCGNTQARTLEIRLTKNLILDAQTINLTPRSIRADVLQAKLDTIRLIGQRQGVQIHHALSCPSAHISCPTKPEQTVPGFHVSGPMTLILENLKLERTGTSQSSQFSGIEAVEGSQLILNAVTISSDDKAQAFAVGIRAHKAKLYLNNSNVFAAIMNIDAQESRVLINADAEKRYYLSPCKVSKSDQATDASKKSTECPTSTKPSEFRANLNLSGPRSAAFIINQGLVGTTSLRTGGQARVKSHDAHYEALSPGTGPASTLLRDLNGSAVVEIVGGTVENYNKLAYLDQNGTELKVALPTSFKLSDCAPSSDNVEHSLAYDPKHHLGGVEQLKLKRDEKIDEKIKVILHDNNCSQASVN
jgi:hypothetical protein